MEKIRQAAKLGQAQFSQLKWSPNLKIKLFSWLAFLLAGTVGLAVASYHLAYWGKIYPGVMVAGVRLESLDPKQAESILTERLTRAPFGEIKLVWEDVSWSLLLEEIGLTLSPKSTTRKAFLYGRRGQPVADMAAKWQALTQGVNLDWEYEVDEASLETQIATISAALFIPAVAPHIEILPATAAAFPKPVKLTPGEPGQELETRSLTQILASRFSQLDFSPLTLPVRTIDPRLSLEQEKQVLSRAQKFLEKKVELVFAEQTWSLGEEELVDFIDLTSGFSQEILSAYVTEVAVAIDRPAENAAFRFEDGRVTLFRPAKEGRSLDRKKTVADLLAALAKLEAGEQEALVNLLVTTTPPAIATEDVNNLGIRELIGRGSSRFRGSIPSRVHNIVLAASRLNGLLIPPGETLSFNQALGDVSFFTGYQQAYIIKDGRTILGDGGGVCQVSTTLFRAALNAGLPIEQRFPHSYRVSYYEQDSGPGLDATVYAPSVDLKIKNDTPAHILIQAETDTKSNLLIFELYGTSDGRVASVGKPRVWAQTPPPEPLYQEDPTLPAGETRQVDFAAWGAKTAFDYRVSRGAEVLQEKTFYSNFRPWQAVYLVGIGPAQ